MYIYRSTRIVSSLAWFVKLQNCIIQKYLNHNATEVYRNCEIKFEGQRVLAVLSFYDFRFTDIRLTHYGEISIHWNPCYEYTEPNPGTPCENVSVSYFYTLT